MVQCVRMTTPHHTSYRVIERDGRWTDLLGFVNYGEVGTMCTGIRNGDPCSFGRGHSGHCVPRVSLVLVEETTSNVEAHEDDCPTAPSPLAGVVEALTRDYAAYWEEESFEYLCGRRATQPLTFAAWFESDVECDQELANEARDLGWSPADLHSIGGGL